MLYVETTVNLTWSERLRALFQGRIHVDSRTYVDVHVGQSRTTVESYFEPMPWNRRRAE